MMMFVTIGGMTMKANGTHTQPAASARVLYFLKYGAVQTAPGTSIKQLNAP